MKKMKKVNMMKNFLALIFALYFSGCASEKILLTEKSLDKLTKYPRSGGARKHGQRKIVLAKIVDARKIRERIGQGKTGVSGKPTPIHYDGGAKKLVEKYLRQHFSAKKIDLQLLHGQTLFRENPRPVFSLEVGLSKLWISEVSGQFTSEHSRCKVELTFQLKRILSNKVVWKGREWSNVLTKAALLDTTDKNIQVLNTCLDNVFSQLFKREGFLHKLNAL